MSEPAWVALGAGPVDYAGDWAAGTQYAPGDVVRHNGVEYLAVNPSLGSTPPQAGAAGLWLPYTPVLAAATTNPTLGPGAIQSGRYCQIGKLVACLVRLQFGTSGVAAGNGLYRVSLPVPAGAAGADAPTWIGNGFLWDNSAGAAALPAVYLESSTFVSLAYPGVWPIGTFTVVNHSAPWAWAAQDQINFHCLYEAA